MRHLQDQEDPKVLSPEGKSRRFAYPPNLYVVDGGAPQVNAASAVLDELGISDVAVIGLAKRLEEVWVPSEPDPIILPRNSEGLYLLQRVRDEAHRFAINYHRSKRSKRMTASALDAVPGLGEHRRKALVAHFGSLARLKEATVDEITAVPGIGVATATAVLDALRGGAAGSDATDTGRARRTGIGMTGEGMDGSNQAGSLGNADPAEVTASQADNNGGANESGIDVVLVTGLSGAGRGTAAKVLEDLGWYVADNLPPQLITRMVDFGLAAGSRITQLAVVMDARSRGFTGDLDWVRNELATRDITPRVLFMEASDDMFVRRYEQNRRSHPLQGEQTLAEGIAAEREMLAPVRATADLIIDTSTLSVRELRESIERAFGGETVAQTSVTVESFGFKYGLPMDADMVMDVRFLPNPHWIDDLRPHTGQHPAVRDYVLGQTGAAEFLETYHRLLSLIVDGYRREGKRYMTVAIGCTGGKHRSVAIAEALARLLEPDKQLSVRVLHRDLGRE